MRSGLEDAAGLRRCAPELPLWECVQGPDSPARLCAGRAPCLGCFGKADGREANSVFLLWNIWVFFFTKTAHLGNRFKLTQRW